MIWSGCWSVKAHATPTLTLNNEAKPSALTYRIHAVPKGWITPAEGLWMDRRSGAVVVGRWSDTERQLRAWRNGYHRLAELTERSNAERVQALQQLQREMAQQSKAKSRARVEGVMIGLIIGVVGMALAH